MNRQKTTNFGLFCGLLHLCVEQCVSHFLCLRFHAHTHISCHPTPPSLRYVMCCCLLFYGRHFAAATRMSRELVSADRSSQSLNRQLKIMNTRPHSLFLSYFLSLSLSFAASATNKHGRGVRESRQNDDFRNFALVTSEVTDGRMID